MGIYWATSCSMGSLSKIVESSGNPNSQICDPPYQRLECIRRIPILSTVALGFTMLKKLLASHLEVPG